MPDFTFIDGLKKGTLIALAFGVLSGVCGRVFAEPLRQITGASAILQPVFLKRREHDDLAKRQIRPSAFLLPVLLYPAGRVLPRNQLAGASEMLPPGFRSGREGQIASAPERQVLLVSTNQTPTHLSENGIEAWTFPLMDRQLSQSERDAPLTPELIDAILRVEGIYDPTRVGLFGPALRMKIRPGTASMNNVFADRWTRADTDPNTHFRVRYLAEAWLRPDAPDCRSFRKFRPGERIVALDDLSPSDCARVKRLQGSHEEPLLAAMIVGAPLSVPAFAAPYPGARLSLEALRIEEQDRASAIREQLHFKWRAGGPAGSARRIGPSALKGGPLVKDFGGRTDPPLQ